MDGTDAARAIGAGARTARIPVVALTALRFDADDEWLLDAGFAGYLEKPIRVAAFPDQVRRYIAWAATVDATGCASTPAARKRARLADRAARPIVVA